ncbi:hypothetical protein [Bacteroides sp.]|uniref:hypothetical protein n=1 Tax=Bacteroides sp. TaxID=29523 RepID=UPI002638F25B|nr:hypothetical protein [Bacteroides sp.]
MKKHYWKIAAITTMVAIATTGCNDDLSMNDSVNKIEGSSLITASIETKTIDTRLSYEDDTELKVTWIDGKDDNAQEYFYATSFPSDESAAINGWRFRRADDATASKDATFSSWEWSSNSFSATNLTVGDEIHALYPASEAATEGYAGTFKYSPSGSVTLPLAGQDGTLANLSKFNYMTAVGTANTAAGTTDAASLELKFKHRVAIFRLSELVFPGLNNGEVKVVGVSGKNLKVSATLTRTKGVTIDQITPTGNDMSILANLPDNTITTDGNGKMTGNIYICFFPGNSDAQGTNEISELSFQFITSNGTYTYNYATDVDQALQVTKFIEGKMYTLNAKTTTHEGFSSNGQDKDGMTAATAFEIANYDDLKLFSNYVNNARTSNFWYNRYYKLTNDITLESDWIPIGNVSETAFQGYFDGDNNTITTTDRLFYYINGNYTKKTKIENLKVACNISKNDIKPLGGIVSNARAYATIINCEVTGTITATGSCGGIVGNAQSTEIEYCNNQATITGASDEGTGGILGEVGSQGATITACWNTGNVTSTNTATGGIIGFDYNDYNITIKGCYNTGNIEAKGNMAAGIMGKPGSKTKVTACYNTGNISIVSPYSSFSYGGICGYKYSGTSATQCYYNSSTISGISSGTETSLGTSVSAIGGTEYGAMNSAWASSAYQFNATTGAIEKKVP